MAAKQKEAKTVRLTAPNGVTVEVDAAKEERLRGQGFTAVKAASKSTSSK